ncbi:serine protease, partial [Streptomyces sp. CSDS2]|uniref:serine protease n=1 Tax=Streptomyces sp. CSDS2 TaxID=3055051 RepID=UPI0025AF2F69
GADLAATDGSVADAARRALTRAARIVAASRAVRPEDLGDVTPEHLARLAARTGRPLLLLLDGPEEMPPALAHRLPEWTRGTADWLHRTGARLLVACREEHWERAGRAFPADLLHAPAGEEGPASVAAAPLPPCLPVGDLTADEARLARARYGIADGVLAERDARHPLTLRLLSEVRAAVPAAPLAGPLDRYDVFAAYLDLVCLRVAVRLAAAGGPRGTAVRRLAARVAGQVHEAARRSLGPGQGELDRESFEAVFPWGPAPARLGAGTGWASAVLAEGLLVPAGGGYRFAHEELADWLHGMHLDLDEALRALVHAPGERSEGARPVPVPHHRIGPVVQSLLFLARQHGSRQLGVRLRELADALERDTGCWWAARLLARTLLQVPDATPYAEVLRLLADRVAAWRQDRRPVPAEFGPAFWTALPVPDTERLDLLRRLVPADPAPSASAARCLDAVAALLAAAPEAVQPLLTRWFTDERPLSATPHATVATAAQALLHTHRHRAPDDLTEVLAACPHPRAEELLGALAEDEPSAVCRATARWAHDERPARRAAAVTYALRAAPHVRTAADRALLGRAARALLARPADHTLHGAALAVLVHDPDARDRHLPAVLRHFADGDPRIPPSALVPALTTHPEPVLDAFRVRLRAPADADLRTLTAITTPALARPVAALLQEAVRLRPETAGRLARRVDRRLGLGTAARPVLLPLVTALLDGGPEPLRASLATVLAGPGTPASRPLRRELLEFLLDRERDPAVLDAVLRAAAARDDTGTGPGEEETRDLVHRTGLLLVRTPEGAARCDRGLADLVRHVPGFAARLARWLTDAPDDWAALTGPGTRRMIENLAGVRVPA